MILHSLAEGPRRPRQSDGSAPAHSPGAETRDLADILAQIINGFALAAYRLIAMDSTLETAIGITFDTIAPTEK
jgi:hypothetical protein